MAEFSYFWAGETTGDTRLTGYTDGDYAERYEKLNLNPLETDNNSLGFIVGTGSLTKEPLQIEENSPNGLSVLVNVGSFLFFGRYYKNDAIKTLTVSENLSGSTRVDSVILSCDWSLQTIRVSIKEGTTVAPSLTQTKGTLWEYKLADITVASAASAITNANIDESFRLPLRKISYTFGDVSAAATVADFSSEGWSETEIKVPEIPIAYQSVNEGIWGTVDQGSNWVKLDSLLYDYATVASVTLAPSGNVPIPGLSLVFAAMHTTVLVEIGIESCDNNSLITLAVDGVLNSRRILSPTNSGNSTSYVVEGLTIGNNYTLEIYRISTGSTITFNDPYIILIQ